MSLLSDMTNIATGMMSGNFSDIASKVQKAIKDGMHPGSPVGKEIAELIHKYFPQLAGKANVVQAIDDLIPDSIQSQFGFTPEVMAFIKQALGGTAGAQTTQQAV